LDGSLSQETLFYFHKKEKNKGQKKNEKNLLGVVADIGALKDEEASLPVRTAECRNEPEFIALKVETLHDRMVIKAVSRPLKSKIHHHTY
jgi:hypothetical protein